MPDVSGNKNSKKEIEHSLDVPDFIIPGKTEASLPVSPQELEKGREAVKKEISEQTIAEKPKQNKPQQPTPIQPPDISQTGSIPKAAKIKRPELIQIESILE